MIILVRNLITIPNYYQVISGLYKLHFIKAIKLIKSEDFDKKNEYHSPSTHPLN